MKNCTPMPPLSVQAIQSFWNFLPNRPEGECWLWTGSVSGTGYGRVRSYGKNVASHRLSVFLSSGLDPIGNSVLHKCDIKRCCNPDHLYLGDHQQNANDRMARGRTTLGRKIPTQKRGKPITEQEVRAMRLLYTPGAITMTTIAFILDIHKNTVWEYLSGRKISRYPTQSVEI